MQDTADQGGGEFLTAADSGQLAAALKNALGGVIKQTAAVASIATNSTRLSTDTAVYQARFSSQDWSGELLAYPINSDGTMGAQLWNAAAQMPTHNARNIFTWSGSAGISFDYASMNATQKTAMGSSALVDYLRGDSSGEQRNGGSYRDRSTVLGDIVNSDALFVGAQDFGYRMIATKPSLMRPILRKRKPVLPQSMWGRTTVCCTPSMPHQVLKSLLTYRMRRLLMRI
jgi:type IV pilus assembly protein PilY1